MKVEAVLSFTDTERAQLEASALKVQLLKCKMEVLQAQAQFLQLAIPRVEHEHSALLHAIGAACAARDSGGATSTPDAQRS